MSLTKEHTIYKIYQILYSHFGPQHWWPGETKLEIVVGAVLTQNTAWQNVEKAIKNLKKKNLLEIKKLYKIRENFLSKLIKPAGYYNLKTKRLKELVKFLCQRYNGNLEKMAKEKGEVLREELLRVKGIGKETADSILLYALNKPFFVVDAYTKRILLRHNLINEKMTYDEIQKLFQENLPKRVKIYNEFHALLVKLGKTYCQKRPKCFLCPLANLLPINRATP
ncbi:MAG: endonuclease III domain-containing protein [candidate division WOR-3 bacterium]